MRILFWGTPDFGVPALRALQEEGHAVVAVVTQPDRPAGRGRTVQPGPIKQIAHEEGIPVLQPEKPRGEVFVARS
jgi:methionyl-tRNA formyltransferase